MITGNKTHYKILLNFEHGKNCNYLAKCSHINRLYKNIQNIQKTVFSLDFQTWGHFDPLVFIQGGHLQDLGVTYVFTFL